MPLQHILSLVFWLPVCQACFSSRPQKSIAFGSAPRREVDSQPISQLARPAVSQTETHSLGFFVSGRPVSKQWGGLLFSGQAVAKW